ncbi:DoxX family protein [Aquihabitans daechungensis]|uniref:DoxX family protein n=1 Tax=Aquihabitans daechungensis TaxID=1052257 RepID=UPI003B9FC940
MRGKWEAMLVRRIARPLLSSVFIAYGVEALRRPTGPAKVAEPVIDLIDTKAVQPAAQKVAAGAASLADDAVSVTADVAETTPDETARAAADKAGTTLDDAADPIRRVAIGGIDLEDETYVRINGAVQVGAGVLLAVGKAPRLASTALAASLIPTTIAGHRFWEYEGDERQQQQVHFLKNVGLLGGLILAAVDTEGRPGLAWRARHLREDSGVIATAAAVTASVAGKAAKADAKAARRLAAANAKLAKANAKVAGKGGMLGVEIAQERAATGWRAARKQARQTLADTAPARHEAAERAIALGHQAQDKAAEWAPKVRDAAAELAPQVRDKGWSSLRRSATRPTSWPRRSVTWPPSSARS